MCEIEASDEDLMAQAQTGSEAHYTTLILRHKGLLRTIIGRVLYNEGDVDDTLGDVMHEVWEKRHTYSAAVGKVLGWMVTMARRRAIDKSRKIKSRSDAMERLTAEYLHGFDLEKATDSKYEEAELLREVDAILDSVPPEQARVFRAHMQGLSQRDMATQWNMPLGTIKTRYELAIRKLKPKLIRKMNNIPVSPVTERAPRHNRQQEIITALTTGAKTLTEICNASGGSVRAVYQCAYTMARNGKIGYDPERKLYYIKGQQTENKTPEDPKEAPVQSQTPALFTPSRLSQIIDAAGRFLIRLGEILK